MKMHPIRHPCPLGDKARLYFKPLPGGRHLCTQCDKPVVDLSGRTPGEIAEYARLNPGTCITLTPVRPAASPGGDACP